MEPNVDVIWMRGGQTFQLKHGKELSRRVLMDVSSTVMEFQATAKLVEQTHVYNGKKCTFYNGNVVGALTVKREKTARLSFPRNITKEPRFSRKGIMPSILKRNAS